MLKSAAISHCGRYRYDLWRRWIGGQGYLMVVGLNPSTADATNDDPTVGRCIDFAQRWGMEALCMTNLFAYRATDPKRMLRAEDPVGPENDAYIRRHAGTARLVLAAWGNHGGHLGRSAQVREMLPKLHVLRLTKQGEPWHPLYVSKDTTPVAWCAEA